MWREYALARGQERHQRRVVVVIFGEQSRVVSRERRSPNAPQPGLMKHRIVFRLQNRPGYSWYQDLDTGHYSFRQFVFIGDESMHLGGVFQKYFDDKSHPAAFGFLRFVCGGTGHGKDTGAVKDAFKKDDVCDFGQFDFKTRFVISQTSPGEYSALLLPADSRRVRH